MFTVVKRNQDGLNEQPLRSRCNYSRFVLMMAGPDSNYHPIVLIKSILETQTMKRTEKKENVALDTYLIYMRIKHLSFLFSCHLEARSVMNMGDYSEVYSNVMDVMFSSHKNMLSRSTNNPE